MKVPSRGLSAGVRLQTRAKRTASTTPNLSTTHSPASVCSNARSSRCCFWRTCRSRRLARSSVCRREQSSNGCTAAGPNCGRSSNTNCRIESQPPMTQDSSTFRDRLLAVEPLPDTVQQRYQQEIQQMLAKELSRPRRALLVVVLLVSVVMAGLFVFLLTTEANLPTVAKIGFALGLVFSLGWIVVLGRILRQGTIDLLQDERRIAQMVWVFTVGMTVLFLFAG